MIFYQRGSETDELKPEDIKQALSGVFEKLGKKKKVMVVPPDHTRFHSRAGEVTNYIWEYYKENLTTIIPALGTHTPMNSKQVSKMFGDIPQNIFRGHDWRNDIVNIGTVPSEFVGKISAGAVNFDISIQVNKMLVSGGHDVIFSVGQVVPHEVTGMANYNKNIFIGLGGAEIINKSHYLGAVCGIENIMGKADTPVRQVLNYASENFTKHLPIVYILTVIGRGNDGKLKMRGLYIGYDIECFNLASELSLKINFEVFDKPLKKVVVFLDEAEYKSVWLGNKSIYRTRMAIADKGELIIIAPGVKEFGEDAEIDRLIRKYGYNGTGKTLKAVEKNEDLKQNLSAAAHLIHGSSEGRFKITYCTGFLTKQEVESVNYNHAEPKEMIEKYNPEKLKNGFNNVDGEEIFYISNPALGLWACKK